MTESPLVSVVIPAYNCAPYIEQTLESALSQNYPEKEIIVVNDGSTDATRDILRKYEGRVRVVDQANSGVAVARSRGMDEARGELIAFLDADDYWYPGKLRMQVQYLREHPDVGIVYHEWIVWPPDEKGVFTLPPQPPTNYDDYTIEPESSGWIYTALFYACIVHTTTAMIRREIADQVGRFDPSLKIGEDYDFWIRASRLTRIDKLKAVLSLYRIHPSSITKKPLDTNYAVIVLQRALGKWGRKGPDGRETPRRDIDDHLAQLWFDFGYQHRLYRNARIARDALWHAIRLRPMRVAAWVNYVRTFVLPKS